MIKSTIDAAVPLDITLSNLYFNFSIRFFNWRILEYLTSCFRLDSENVPGGIELQKSVCVN